MSKLLLLREKREVRSTLVDDTGPFLDIPPVVVPDESTEERQLLL